MNMTIVIISGRSLEAAMLFAAASLIIILQLVSASAINGNKLDAKGDEILEQVRAVIDEDKPLDGELLSSITRDFGESIKETMSSELRQLVSEMEQKPAEREMRGTANHASGQKIDETELKNLLEANRVASEDIRARVELVGDNTGKLPQMSLGSTANSLLQAASQRLATTSSFIGSKMSTLKANVAKRIPSRLKALFRWPNFLSFKIKFHKRYPTLRMDLYRNFVFLKNQILVSMRNIRFILGKQSFILGQTQYADMTEAEYSEKVGNKLLADEQIEQTPGDQAKLMAAMKTLSASGRNIYGDQIGTLEPKQKKRRSRRSVDEYDELSATEDEDDIFMSDEHAFGQGITQMDIEMIDLDGDDDDYDGDAFMVVDQYAADAKFPAVDSVLSDVTHALKPDTKFQPVDLRETGCIHQIENQEDCGICYALASVVLGAYHNCMAGEPKANGRRVVRHYHAGFVSECGRYYTPPGRPYMMDGCVGGHVSKAVDFVRQTGLAGFMDYHWAQISARLYGTDTCPYPRPTRLSDHSQWAIKLDRVNFLQQARQVALQPEKVHMHLAAIGPVLVNLALWPGFDMYAGGVMDTIGDKTGDVHSMVVVGHEYDVRGREVYIIWNSHGVPWGEHGFLRMTAEAFEYYAMIIIGTAPENVD